MNTFISESTEVKERFAELEPMGPSPAEWEARRAAFAPGKKPAVTPVTVGSQVPLEPYGEHIGFFRRLLRRVARKSIRWYTDELLRQQNEVNRALLSRIEELEARIKELEER